MSVLHDYNCYTRHPYGGTSLEGRLVGSTVLELLLSRTTHSMSWTNEKLPQNDSVCFYNMFWHSAVQDVGTCKKAAMPETEIQPPESFHITS